MLKNIKHTWNHTEVKKVYQGTSDIILNKYTKYYMFQVIHIYYIVLRQLKSKILEIHK